MATKNESAAIQALGKEWAEKKKAGASQTELDRIHKQAQELREKEGYTANSRGENHTSTKSSGSSKNKNTYVPKGTYNDADLTGSALNQMNQYKQQWVDAKAAGDSSGMEAAHAAAEALRKQFGYSGGSDGSDYIGMQTSQISMPKYSYDGGDRPTYKGKYQSEIDDLLNSILTRDDFSYDVEKDPLYQQYKQQYLREGTRAMDDTLASAAANAGGMNSYAINAAQQANNYYSAQLNDRIPELYQLAYGMYLDDIDQDVRDLGLLNDMDATQYSRYRNTMSDWENDRDFAYNKYRDDMGDYFNDRNFNYNAGRDQISDSRYDKEWEYTTGRATQTAAYNQAMDFLTVGIMPSALILQAAGISTSEAQAYINRVMAAEALSGSSARSGRTGGGVAGVSGVGGGSGNSVFQEAAVTANKVYDVVKNLYGNGSGTSSTSGDDDVDIDMDSVAALGYGSISPSKLAELERSGEIIAYKEGGKIKYRKNPLHLSF